MYGRIQRSIGGGGGSGAGGGGGSAPGKRSRTDQLRPAALRVGVAPESVRVHEDGVAESHGARAVAVGDDLHFGKGELDGPDASFLIGHELAHVVQQRAGEPGVQARGERPGAGELEREADRVGEAIASDRWVDTIVGRAEPGRPQKFESPEHRAIGDKGSESTDGTISEVELAPGYTVSYGEMVAMAGDFFGSVDEMRALAANPGRGAGTREEIEYVRNAKVTEDDSKIPYYTEEARKAADQRYYKLATRNASHFLNPVKGDQQKATLAKAEGKLSGTPSYYRKYHLQALSEAVEAGGNCTAMNDAMMPALAANGFADHYLTDSFSGGHVRTARASVSDYWNGKVHGFFDRFKAELGERLAQYITTHKIAPAAGVVGSVIAGPIGGALAGAGASKIAMDKLPGYIVGKISETLAAKGVPDLQFGDVVSGALHDRDNAKGVDVTIEGKDKTLFGDGHLNQGDTLDAVTNAVRWSVDDVYRAYQIGRDGGDLERVVDQLAPQGLFRAEQMMPVVKADDKQTAGRESVKWEVDTWQDLMKDPRFQEALGYMLEDKKKELASVGASLDSTGREAFQHAVLDNMSGAAGLELIKSILSR